MNLWQQNYDPAGNIWLSSLIASLPILFFFFALIKLKLKGYLAATYTVAIALLVALFFAYRRIFHPVQACKPGEVCAVPQVRGSYKLIFWIVAALVLVALAFPFVVPFFY